jgi:hypothetical protein
MPRLLSLRTPYFDWAETLAPVATLARWARGGLALGLLGDAYGPHVRRARPTRGMSTTPQEAAA